MLLLIDCIITGSTATDFISPRKKKKNPKSTAISTHHELHNSICFVCLFLMWVFQLFAISQCRCRTCLQFSSRRAAWIVAIIWWSKPNCCLFAEFGSSFDTTGMPYIIAVYCLMDECVFFSSSSLSDIFCCCCSLSDFCYCVVVVVVSYFSSFILCKINFFNWKWIYK